MPLELPARGARTVTSHELASGLGDQGPGTWRLSLTADQSIAAMSLLQSPAGHLANLSTSTPRGVRRRCLPRPHLRTRRAVEVHPVPRRGAASPAQRACSSCPRRYRTTRATTSEPSATSSTRSRDGASYVLNKIQGVGHGGGAQVPAGTGGYANMERFLALLGEDVTPAPPITPETLFDTVRMASTRKTLRRAALIFAGRIPTDAEYATAERGPTALRATIRGFMTGPEFHEFLIRGANDRLLTDRGDGVIGNLSGPFVELINEYYRRVSAAHRERQFQTGCV